MKNLKFSVKKEVHPEVPAVLVPQDSDDQLDAAFPSYWGGEQKPAKVAVRRVPRFDDDDVFPSYDAPWKDTSIKLDPLDSTILGKGIPNYVLDPKSLQEEFPPLATADELEALDKVVKDNPFLIKQESPSAYFEGVGLHYGFDSQEAWIQTYSGRRFNPLKPNPEAIVLQDIAHSLSMMCRFTGHTRKFYSVAQHSVLVSYICDSQFALWGLLHDASEAYLIDVPRPLKRSGKFQFYKDCEKVMQEAVCKRFRLPLQEPPSVKKADTILLSTEARDLMSPLHPDWKQPVAPLPFVIEAWEPQHAKDAFIRRFFELTDPSMQGYQFYLNHKAQL